MFKIHFSVFLFGITGLFAKFVSAPSTMIVFGRCVSAIIVLYIIIKQMKIELNFDSKKDLRLTILSGILFFITWYFFFQCIKVSTVSVGLLAYATTSIFTTFIEPIVLKTKIRKLDILCAFGAFFGVAIIVPKLSLSNNTTLGILLGLLAALTSAILSTMCRDLVSRNSSIKMAFFQYSIVALLGLPFLTFQYKQITIKDIMFLVILGTIFTAYANTLFISGLKTVSATKAMIILTLEPVYGIILAILLLHERLTLKMTIGGIIILASVFAATITHKNIKNILKNNQHSL